MAFQKRTTEEKNEQVRQLQQQLEQGLEQLVTSEDWAAMLETAAKFHHYSAGNVMLIQVQRPEASRVAGYRAWQALGRQVRKGERGITILAPCTYRYKTTEDDGTEHTHVGIKGFTTTTVFDVAQTDGEPIADVRPQLLAGVAPVGLWDALAKQIAAAGFMLERGDCAGANGVTSYASRTVTVRSDVDDAQACKTLAHELGHVLCGHESELFAVGCRGRHEVEAESVAFVVCQAVGMATDGYSLPYVARWADGDLRKVRETADKVVRVAGGILELLEAVA